MGLIHEAENIHAFNLSKPIDVPEAVSGQSEHLDLLDIYTFETPDVHDTLEQLESWDLLSEPLHLYEPAHHPEHLNRSSPEHPLLDETINEPPAPEKQIPPPVRVSCEGNCNGDLIGPHTCKRDGKALRITCLSARCTSKFPTKHGFNRHCKSAHKLGNLIDCEFPGCAKIGSSGFTRRDNMVQHLRDVHGMEAAIRKYRIKGPVRGYVH